MVQNRNYGIDLLRMLSMLMVVTLHVLGHGGILGSLSSSSISYKLIWLLETGCYCAVNCYVLISGYVNINTKYKYSNIIVLWLQVLFYSLLISLGLFMLNKTNNDVVLQSLFPLFNDQYWYFSSYFGLFLLIPILNKAINTFDKKTLKRIVYLLVIFISVFPTIFQKDIFNTNNGYSMIWFIVLYIIGAYLGKYKSYKLKSFTYLVLYSICIILTWLSKLGIEKYSLIDNSHILINYTSPTILMAGIFLVIFFSNFQLNIPIKKVICFFSSTSFGVYLIHEHPLIRSLVIKNRFVGYSTMPTDKLLFLIGGIVISIYIVCSLIDFMRLFVFDKLQIKYKTNRIERKIMNDD